MGMLEGRAAARESMGRLDEALEDGNRMLKTEKTNPKVTFPIYEQEIIEGLYLPRTFVRGEKEAQIGNEMLYIWVDSVFGITHLLSSPFRF
jgi:hypothetical protein